jgi:transposase-like protein
VFGGDTFQKFRDEPFAFAFVESAVWPNGAVCPHCGAADHIGTLRGRSTQQGSYKCYRCRKIFTVKSGTFFESSNIPLHKWLQAIYLCGWEEIRPSYLSQVLGVSFKTAAFMIGRIRYAATQSTLSVLGHHPDDRRPIDAGPQIGEECEHLVQRTRASEAQFERFVVASTEHLPDDLAEQFETTFSKIVRSKLKLRVWRERASTADTKEVVRS